MGEMGKTGVVMNLTVVAVVVTSSEGWSSQHLALGLLGIQTLSLHPNIGKMVEPFQP